MVNFSMRVTIMGDMSAEKLSDWMQSPDNSELSRQMNILQFPNSERIRRHHEY